ncbi:hypothetical protein [Streptomyces sp. VRA16 Mangrove soil]|uniref:hypothetical protein n=1 Tax=Streptomyces sp. VRA16 Mangrove soil TaxID=2817434 RepID=UPI001A9E74E8|nr:hypothetical protein [Streptomyces sp. VRA16 Mangrove soil]MBO1336300.1 hypothetical protein [Streptomyces sp. VRA16 Mangrove soil]
MGTADALRQGDLRGFPHVGRALLATLALHRLSAFPMNSRFAGQLPGAKTYFDRARSYCDAVARGKPTWVDPLVLQQEYEAVVKVDGEYVEEPDGPESWCMDALDVAEYAVSAWRDSERNQEAVQNALGSLESFVDMVEEMSPRMDGDDSALLPVLEAERQVADFAVIRAAMRIGPLEAAKLDALYTASRELAFRYRDRLLLVP